MPLVIAHGGVSGTERHPGPLGHAPASGGSVPTALDAVELTVRGLEDQPGLNAGFGATLTSARTIELDAGLMDGATGAAGSVAGVAVRHPITLARRVLECTPHVLMIGTGAMALAAGMEMVHDTTPEQHERWARAEAAGSLNAYGIPDHVDTVGALALDDEGNLAAASSTGGVFGKLPGRVGDAPIVGAGFYAGRAAAAVGTGVGEVFLRTLACREVVRSVEEGVAVQDAADRLIRFLRTVADITCGILVLDADGAVGAAYRGAGWRVETSNEPIEAHRLV